jgi:hypothetical protein
MLVEIRFFFRSCAHCDIGGRQFGLPATSPNPDAKTPSSSGAQG